MPKGKGSAFERLMCRKLSMWWTDNLRDDVFWRSAGSGAMAKTRSKVGRSTYGQYGDIQAVDPIGKPLLDCFTIELKRGYSSFSFMDVMDAPGTAARQMWTTQAEQVLLDTKNAGSLSWLLITRRDRREALVYLPTTTWAVLADVNGGRRLSTGMMRALVETKKFGKIDITCMQLDVLLSTICTQDIFYLIERGRGDE